MTRSGRVYDEQAETRQAKFERAHVLEARATAAAAEPPSMAVANHDAANEVSSSSNAHATNAPSPSSSPAVATATEDPFASVWFEEPNEENDDDDDEPGAIPSPPAALSTKSTLVEDTEPPKSFPSAPEAEEEATDDKLDDLIERMAGLRLNGETDANPPADEARADRLRYEDPVQFAEWEASAQARQARAQARHQALEAQLDALMQRPAEAGNQRPAEAGNQRPAEARRRAEAGAMFARVSESMDQFDETHDERTARLAEAESRRPAEEAEIERRRKQVEAETERHEEHGGDSARSRSTLIYEGVPTKSLGSGREWPPGWTETHHKRCGSSKVDKYWHPPNSARRLRSLPEVQRHLAALEVQGGDDELARKEVRNPKPLPTKEAKARKEAKAPNEKKTSNAVENNPQPSGDAHLVFRKIVDHQFAEDQELFLKVQFANGSIETIAAGQLQQDQPWWLAKYIRAYVLEPRRGPRPWNDWAKGILEPSPNDDGTQRHIPTISYSERAAAPPVEAPPVEDPPVAAAATQAEGENRTQQAEKAVKWVREHIQQHYQRKLRESVDDLVRCHDEQLVGIQAQWNNLLAMHGHEVEKVLRFCVEMEARMDNLEAWIEGQLEGHAKWRARMELLLNPTQPLPIHGETQEKVDATRARGAELSNQIQAKFAMAMCMYQPNPNPNPEL